MNNTLTAKEWLKRWNIKDDMVYDLEGKYKSWDISDALEQYSNYKSRILEEKIMEFGKLLKNEQIHATNENITIGNKMHNLLSVYNEHFNIENKQ